MKMKMIMLTAIMTLSFSVVTEATMFSEKEHEKDAGILSEESKPSLNDIPFLDILESAIPLYYPPLELLKEKPETYTVEAGDNLYRIALNNGMTVEDLMNLNQLTSEIIYPGDILTVSGEDPGSEVAALASVKVASVSQDTIPKPVTKPTQKTVPKEPAFNKSVSTPPASSGTEFVVTATAYTAYCTGCSGTTAYGIDLRSNPNQKVIAVDPTIIPLGTKVWVEGYGEAIAGDVGSAIKGHKIDVFIPSYDSAMEWGVKKVKIKIIN